VHFRQLCWHASVTVLCLNPLAAGCCLLYTAALRALSCADLQCSTMLAYACGSVASCSRACNRMFVVMLV
jgi:hypothetical protein